MSEVNVEVPPRTEVAAVAADEADILVGWDIIIAIFLLIYILLLLLLTPFHPRHGSSFFFKPRQNVCQD